MRGAVGIIMIISILMMIIIIIPLVIIMILIVINIRRTNGAGRVRPWASKPLSFLG